MCKPSVQQIGCPELSVVIDVASNTVSVAIDLKASGTASPSSVYATVLAVAADGASAYVGMVAGSGFNGDAGLVRVVDPQKRAVVAMIDLDMVPTAITADPIGEQV